MNRLTAFQSGSVRQMLRIRAAAITVLLALPGASAWAADTSDSLLPGPQAVMEDLSARLFAALDKLPTTTRHNADEVLISIDTVLFPCFDVEYAGRLVLGKYWRDATPAQRQQFAMALYRRLIRTYAGEVAGWTADRVKILPLRSDPEALQVTVHTQVANAQASVVNVDFRLRQTGQGWKIFDAVVDGVSYVRNYHDDTDTEITQKGLDAAIARLARTDSAEIERARSHGSSTTN